MDKNQIKPPSHYILQELRYQTQLLQSLTELMSKSTSNTSGYLDVKQSAIFAKCSEISIRRWIKSGKLESYRIPGTKKHLIAKNDLEKLMNWNKQSLNRGGVME